MASLPKVGMQTAPPKLKKVASPKRPLAKGFSQMQKMMGRGTGTPRKPKTPSI